MMPSGGLRKPLKPKEFEELDCHGHLAVARPHKFKRLKGSDRTQCDNCWNSSIGLHSIPVFKGECERY